LTWDRIDHKVVVFDADRNSYETYPFTLADTLSMYAAETEHFLACARGEQAPLIDLADGIKTMEVIMAVFESSGTGKAVSLHA
jgi:predicted dehydrogenase